MIPRLVVLTDRSQLGPGRDLVATVAECAAAGLRAVVVREPDLPPAARAALVEQLGVLPGLTVISSRLADPRADGLHLSATQPAPHHRLWGGLWVGPWGRSCHSRDDVRRAAAEGAGWATLSPYAASLSKPGHRPVLPPADFADLPVPVLALAGVDASNAGDAVAAGAHGVAVMGAVMRADDPAAVVADLLAAVA